MAVAGLPQAAAGTRAAVAACGAYEVTQNLAATAQVNRRLRIRALAAELGTTRCDT
jgi:hypothetical protein